MSAAPTCKVPPLFWAARTPPNVAARTTPTTITIPGNKNREKARLLMISDLLRRSNRALICECRSRTQGIRLAATCAETPPAISPLADAQLYALWATKINHGDGAGAMGQDRHWGKDDRQ